MTRILMRALLPAVLGGLMSVGTTLALFTASTETTGPTFTTGTVQIISWRSNGDRPFTPINQIGAPHPMFYTTVEEGLEPDPDAVEHEPKKATGVWAPGDTHTRVLTVRNLGTIVPRLAGISATLYGDTEMAEWYEVEIWASPGGANKGDRWNDKDSNSDRGKNASSGGEKDANETDECSGNGCHLIWEGTLADLDETTLSEAYQPFVRNLDFLVLEGQSSVKLTFKITLAKTVGNPAQGKTVKADFHIHAVQQGD